MYACACLAAKEASLLGFDLNVELTFFEFLFCST